MPPSITTMTRQQDEASSKTSIHSKVSAANLETVPSSVIETSFELDEETNRKLLRKIDWKLMPVAGRLSLLT